MFDTYDLIVVSIGWLSRYRRVIAIVSRAAALNTSRCGSFLSRHTRFGRIVTFTSLRTSFRFALTQAPTIRFEAVRLVEIELFEVDIDDLAVQDLYHSVNSWS